MASDPYSTVQRPTSNGSSNFDYPHSAPSYLSALDLLFIRKRVA